jgi:hypothetical protein
MRRKRQGRKKPCRRRLHKSRGKIHRRSHDDVLSSHLVSDHPAEGSARRQPHRKTDTQVLSASLDFAVGKEARLIVRVRVAGVAQDHEHDTLVAIRSALDDEMLRSVS